MDAEEHLAIELARLRAKFGVDPAIGEATLDDAWASPTAPMEEDEAEFIDAVADCLGVGLSLDAALDCWDAGGLLDDGTGTDRAEADADEDDVASIDLSFVTASSAPSAAASHPRPGGRRVFVG
jgi:hypothetical protein